MTINGNFTDCDTVEFGNGEELIVDDYLGKLKDDIRSGKIRKFSYDASNECLTYNCLNKNNLQDSYTVKISNNGSRNIRRIQELIDLSKAKQVHEENVTKEENRKKQLLVNAKSGKIETDEAKSLYMEELKNQRIKAITDNIYLTFKNYEPSGQALAGFTIFLLIVDGITLAILGIGAFEYGKSLALFKIFAFSSIAFFGSLFIPKCEFIYTIIKKIFKGLVGTLCLIPNIIYSIGKIIKNGLPKIKVINHKIKWLSDYHLPEESIDIQINEDVDNKDLDFAKGYINSIHEALLSLGSSDKEIFRSKLNTLIDDYYKEMAEINALVVGQLTTKSAYSARTKFLVGLSDLCKEMSKKILADKNPHSFDYLVRTLQSAVNDSTNTSNVVMTSDGKVRRLEIN